MANDEKLIKKLQDILALTDSPSEGEASAASAMLQKLLTKYNLEMADLESQGLRKAPGIIEVKHDLAKAGFQWKIDLAAVLAQNYFCKPIIHQNRNSKSLGFIGRPENVESLVMMYAWLVDQIRRIATEGRREHMANGGEHIDPLRWQLNFGLGAVERIQTRLTDERKQQAASTTALVIHHDAEIAEFLGQTYNNLRPTKRPQQRHDGQSWAARDSGYAAGGNINLKPFVGAGAARTARKEVK